jgi:ectoine hydroxylase-related dioxygenase (phytanoyl-CoA dioxygenase family)
MPEDLSNYHHPITDFSRTGDWHEFKLTDHQVEFYKKNGYLANVPWLDQEQVDRLRADLSQLVRPEQAFNPLFYEYNSNESGDPNTVLFHALGAWRVAESFHDLLWHLPFLVAASQLLEGPVRFWHDQIFYKPAHHGGVVAWHQDYSYWTRTKPLAHLSCWIGLDQSNRDNGCVHYVPGSHHWNLLPMTGLANDMDAIESVLSAEERENFKPVPIELKSGEASFHHPLMIHGSFENSTEHPRRGVVINVVRDGVCSDSDDPLLEGIPPIPKGHKLDGQFFPLLFQPPSAD